MKFLSFFKLLNKKINKYDKYASNPFSKTNEGITIVWVENNNNNNNNN